jgi:hypothetical protein
MRNAIFDPVSEVLASAALAINEPVVSKNLRRFIAIAVSTRPEQTQLEDAFTAKHCWNVTEAHRTVAGQVRLPGSPRLLIRPEFGSCRCRAE